MAPRHSKPMVDGARIKHMGDLRDLLRDVLPTVGSVLEAYYWLRMVYEESNQKWNVSFLCYKLVDRIMKIWSDSKIATMPRRSVYNKVHRLVNCNKSSRRRIEKHYRYVELTLDNADELFDISACKCKEDECVCGVTPFDQASFY